MGDYNGIGVDIKGPDVYTIAVMIHVNTINGVFECLLSDHTVIDELFLDGLVSGISTVITDQLLVICVSFGPLFRRLMICGQKLTHFWRPKPDNQSKRQINGYFTSHSQHICLNNENAIYI